MLVLEVYRLRREVQNVLGRDLPRGQAGQAQSRNLSTSRAAVLACRPPRRPRGEGAWGSNGVAPGCRDERG
eukprot:365932-Chlamydomonas_euryale.AAC.11